MFSTMSMLQHHGQNRIMPRRCLRQGVVRNTPARHAYRVDPVCVSAPSAPICWGRQSAQLSTTNLRSTVRPRNEIQ
jgi:hypothetical protein